MKKTPKPSKPVASARLCRQVRRLATVHRQAWLLLRSIDRSNGHEVAKRYAAKREKWYQLASVVSGELSELIREPKP